MSDVNYKISADASAVVQEIGKVRKLLAGLGKLNWANMAMGVQAVMGFSPCPWQQVCHGFHAAAQANFVIP